LQLQDPRIVGSWRSPNATCTLGSAQHTAGSPSTTCAIDLLTHSQAAIPLAGSKAIWVLPVQDPSLFWALHNQSPKTILGSIECGPKDSWVLACPKTTYAMRCATPPGRQHKRHVGAGGVPGPQAIAQAPRVPGWFFFDNNTNF